MTEKFFSYKQITMYILESQRIKTFEIFSEGI